MWCRRCLRGNRSWRFIENVVLNKAILVHYFSLCQTLTAYLQWYLLHWKGWSKKVLKVEFGFGRDMLPQNLKEDPYKYQFFKKSDTFIYQLAQFWAKFWAKLHNFSKLFKNWPIHIPNSAFIRGHSSAKRLILLSMLVARPRRVFCIEYSPPPSVEGVDVACNYWLESTWWW